MPVVCINRPNRSEPRNFTGRDAARIAVYASEKEGTLAVLAIVVSALGYQLQVCSVAKVFNALAELAQQAQRLPTAESAARTLATVQQWIRTIQEHRYGQFSLIRRFVAVVVLFLLMAQDFINLVLNLRVTFERAAVIRRWLNLLCSQARLMRGVLGESSLPQQAPF